MLIPTRKETPVDAELPSHQLMLRAGYINQLTAGIYTLLPLAWRSVQKIAQIIRDEMNRSGAQELLLPMVQPAEIWQQSGKRITPNHRSKKSRILPHSYLRRRHYRCGASIYTFV